jgi:hypothetical protein
MGMVSGIIIGVSVMLDMESDVMELRLKTWKMFFMVVAAVVMRKWVALRCRSEKA